MNPGFLDFSSLEKRLHFCHEEVRLNRRFAPGLYLGVVPIGGPPSAPRVGDDSGGEIEGGVKLVQFDESARLDALPEAGRLPAEHCRRLGREIARIEGTLAVADRSAGHGSPERLADVFAMNISQIRRHRPDLAGRADAVGAWLRERLVRDRQAFLARLEGGRIRECHGDLHLANIVLLDGMPVAYDCIEFNPDLRWIDVASDVAFVTMDLAGRGRPDLAAEVTSAWMEAADDHAAASVLSVHRVARAVVRAAVAAIRAAQEGGAPADARVARADTERYLALAESLSSPCMPRLVVVTGPSGSGKSTLAGTCVARLEGVRLRSDVERKRLFGMGPTDRAEGPRAAALYSPETTRRVYERLATLARGLLAAGATVVVDATGNSRWQREILAAAARETGAGIAWLEIDLPLETLLARVADRWRSGTDPSDATAETVRLQVRSRDPITPAELAACPAPATHLVLDAARLACPGRIIDDATAAFAAPGATEAIR